MKQVKTETATVSLFEENIIKIEYFNANIKLEIRHIKENYDSLKNLIKKKRGGLWIILGKGTSISKEAKSYVNEQSEHWEAIAVQPYRLWQVKLGNTFMHLNRRSDFQRFFGFEEDALKWLNSKIADS